MKVSKIVIAATQRSGSTMICEDLSRTHVLGHPNEWFLEWKPEDDKDWRSELNGILSKATTANGIFSIKLMANQLRSVDSCLSTFVEPVKGTHPHLLAIFDETLWIWVRRRDTLGQAISHFLAQRSNVYHVRTAQTEFERGASVHIDSFDEKTGGEVPYDFQAINREWHILRQHDFVWDSFFKSNNIRPMLIWYEDAAINPVGPKVAEEVGVVPLGEDSGRAYGKMPSGRNKMVRKRFLDDLFSRH